MTFVSREGSGRGGESEEMAPVAYLAGGNRGNRRAAHSLSEEGINSIEH